MTLAIVGGYRLVRRLAGEGGAELWIGVSSSDADEQRPVVLKLYRADWPAHRIATEIESLARAAGPHVVGVVDIATSLDGRTALVLERLDTRTLASLLAARGSLSQGEAVTVLVPLAQALSRMHRAGVAHGALRASAIGFTHDGAPVITAFDEALVRPVMTTRAERDNDAALREDARAFRALCEETIEGAVASDGIVDWLEQNATGASWIDDLPARLFAWAASDPIDFARAERAPNPAPVSQELRRSRLGRPPGGVVGRLRALGGDGVVWSYWRTVLAGHARNVRPRFWVMGGSVAGLLVIAGIVFPAAGGDATAGTESTVVTPSPSGPAEVVAVAGEDPVEALRVLLDTRAQCIRDLSVLCLDAVAQVGSAALEQDQELIRSLREGSAGSPDLLDGELVLDEKLGGTALVRVSSDDAEPASILVMRSEAGWRIRDYLD